MVFTTEKVAAKNTQTPTSVYLNSETMTEALTLSIKFSEQLLASTTNLHINRLWKIYYNEKFLQYFGTPDKILADTGSPHYFKQLLKYQNIAGILKPNDLSTYKYRRLYSKYQAVVKDHQDLLPDAQRKAFVEVLQLIAANPNVSINDLNIEISSDNELALWRKEEDGVHYILVGDDLSDISYLFISNLPGYYSSLHIGDDVSLENILHSFSA